MEKVLIFLLFYNFAFKDLYYFIVWQQNTVNNKQFTLQ